MMGRTKGMAARTALGVALSGATLTAVTASCDPWSGAFFFDRYDDHGDFGWVDVFVDDGFYDPVVYDDIVFYDGFF